MYAKLLQPFDTAKVKYNIQRTKTIDYAESQFLNIIDAPTEYQKLVVGRFINQNFLIERQDINQCYSGRVVSDSALNPILQRPLLDFPTAVFNLQGGASTEKYLARPTLNTISLKQLLFIKNIRSNDIALSAIAGGWQVENNLIYSGSPENIVAVFIPYINCIIVFGEFNPESITISYSFDLYAFQYHCRMSPSQFNRTNNRTAYSSSSIGDVQVYDPYITTVGLYNTTNQLLAVAKLSQPIKKSSIIEQTIIIQFDYVP